MQFLEVHGVLEDGHPSSMQRILNLRVFERQLRIKEEEDGRGMICSICCKSNVRRKNY
jgi:hypothetical protein